MIRTAFAINSDGILAPTLGSAVFFLIREDNGVMERVSARGMIPEILKEAAVKRLFCGGIGVCLLSLLEGIPVQVIPGCSGEPETLLRQWEKGCLVPDSAPLCSDHGRTCGNCPGRF